MFTRLGNASFKAASTSKMYYTPYTRRVKIYLHTINFSRRSLPMPKLDTRQAFLLKVVPCPVRCFSRTKLFVIRGNLPKQKENKYRYPKPQSHYLKK